MPLITPEILRSSNPEQAIRDRWDSVPRLQRRDVIAEEIRALPGYERWLDNAEATANRYGARGQEIRNYVASARVQINRANVIVRQSAEKAGVDTGGLRGATTWIASLTVGAVLLVAGAMLGAAFVIFALPAAIAFIAAVVALGGLMAIIGGLVVALSEPGAPDPTGNPTPSPIERFGQGASNVTGLAGILVVGGLLLAALMLFNKRRAA